MTILQSTKDKINQRAFSRFLKNKKTSQHLAAVKDSIRQGDIDYREAAANSGVCVDVCLSDRVSVRPDGYFKSQKRLTARAGEGSSVDETTGAKAPLVLPAKSRSDFIEDHDQETGEIQRLTFKKSSSEFVPVFDPSESLLNRFALQAEARNILKSETRLNEAGRPIPVYRVCDCLRNNASGVDGVAVVGTTQSDKARFVGLQTCGSIWHCAVCAARIAEVRRKQLREMVDIWQKSGKGVIFITNTIRHHFDDDLRLLLSNMLDIVWPRYTHHYTYKKLRKELGYIGRVRSIEVTHGVNGWHPHIHEIWLIEKTLSPVELQQVQKKLFKVWNTTLTNSGMLSVTAKRGVTVQNGSNASDYVAKFGHEPKWDMARELTQSHSKRASGDKGRTPFDLLRDSLLGDSQATYLFKEYAIAFAGKRQLYFSTGLKKYFLLDEKTDEQIASSVKYDTVNFAHIDRDSWRFILAFGSRAVVLLIAQSGGSPAVSEYVAGLRHKQRLLQQKYIPV